MPTELAPRYHSKETESKWYPLWESKGYFRPRSDRATGDSPKRDRSLDLSLLGLSPYPYVIVIPPPNVTGILHMGHALNNTLQDILIRYQRMKGRDTLWVPGVDHAGIATQNVVEKKLAKEKKTRHDLGREKFLKEVWKWKEENGSTITRQLRRLGASCDWSRERFTMDPGLSKAVREAFVTLYERGLIYQGNYIINWCPRCQTALSDEEAAHKEVQGGLYHIQYPIVPLTGQLEREHIVVATTRPETMLGDTAVAVHPNDPRYQHLIGKKVLLPLIEREIPVIADEFVDPEFGTGIVKVTPAHDPNDFEMGRRHNLPQVNVMHPNGVINENGGRYKGLDRFQARKQVIADLEVQGLFVRRDSHLHAVGHCYRCDTVIEPYLSKQWFVKMKPLAEKALKAHREGKIKFYPDRWTKVYTNWLEGIRDWCISRQIWWGHRVPAWYCLECNPQLSDQVKLDPRGGQLPPNQEIPAAHFEFKDGIRPVDDAVPFISRDEKPQGCPEGHHGQIVQHPDVLDTWFSSWLWPFSTLGWPDKINSKSGKEDPSHFYPTSDLITAPEIIFFWVARMIMAGLEFMGEVPFSRIYIHGTVRAQSGLKMSKSLGNAIDPIEVIEDIGADALRFSMVMLSAQDVYLSREKFEVGRNFTNKIWNAARFVLMNLGDNGALSFPRALSGNLSLGSPIKTFGDDMSLPNRWILSRLSQISGETEKLISGFNLSQAATELYHFVWNDFCDWFIELSKPVLTAAEGKEKEETQKTLFFVLERILKLLHPFMPFMTEEIWHRLKEMSSDSETWPETIMTAPWPEEIFEDQEALKSIQYLQDAVSGIRDMRLRVNLSTSQAVTALVVSDQPKILQIFSGFIAQIKILGRLEALRLERDFQKSKSYIGNAFPDFEIFLQIEGLVDPVKERDRIEKKIVETKGRIETLRTKLSNSNFIQSAPATVVEKEREKLADAQKILKSHQEHLALFQ